MNGNSILKAGVLGMASLLFAVHASGADKIAASAILAELSTISVEAQANVVDAAATGNLEAMAEANRRADAVDAAVAAGQAASTAMDRAIEANDQDAADAAEDGVKDALQMAKDGLNGIVPKVSATKAWKASKKNTGGGPADPYDAPNMYDIPSKTKVQQGVAQKSWGTLWSSGAIGSGLESGGFADREATPE
ncbi:hypothetical protein [Pontiella sp.]|uniref:hypothetical protein n=1 Tax=Pontiella sp. TaxID=2837462 RepID=UPI003566EA38